MGMRTSSTDKAQSLRVLTVITVAKMGGDRGGHARDTCFFVQDNMVDIECRNQKSV